jgi:hypothetical protein
MDFELAQHLSTLLESKGIDKKLSIVQDNHKSHRKYGRHPQRSRSFDSPLDEEEYGDCLDIALGIVSDNPRSHVGFKANRARSSMSRVHHSASAPVLRRHTISMDAKPSDRWGVGSASSQNARLGSRNVKCSVSKGLGGMKQPPIRPSLGGQSSPSLGGQSNNNDQGSKNASWDKPSSSKLHSLGSNNNLRNARLGSRNVKCSVSKGLGGVKQPPIRPSLGGQSNNNDQSSKNASWDKPSSSKLHSLGSHNNRLRNLGLAGFNTKKPEGKRGASGVPTPRQCRWTIPKTSSDSAFVHPTRHREL